MTCEDVDEPEVPQEDIPVFDCSNFDCAADFDRCANFDESECGGCDVSFLKPEPITLTGMQHVEAFALNGVPNFERCHGGNLKVSLKLKTSADFTTRTYQRQFFRMAQTASNDVPNGGGKDTRPSLSIDSSNRIILSDSPFLTQFNDWTPLKYFYWPTGVHVTGDGTGQGVHEMFNTDTTVRVEPDTLYEISIEWNVNIDGSAATKDQIILTINDSVTRMDLSTGDYFCHNHMDMIISFGETVENSVASGLRDLTFENIEGEVFDVFVTGLCPFPEEPERDMCCDDDSPLASPVQYLMYTRENSQTVYS